MNSLKDVVRQLRELLSCGEHDVDSVQQQMLYEKWLKEDNWVARTQALPLIVGADPNLWQELRKPKNIATLEEVLWTGLQSQLGRDASAPIEISEVEHFARTNDIAMPTSFARLYEFIRKTLLVTAPDTAGTPAHSPPNDARVLGERVIVLGAALSLLSKMPERCRDANGFADGQMIAGLIEQMAARWFSEQPPAMSYDEMANLIDQWLE